MCLIGWASNAHILNANPHTVIVGTQKSRIRCVRFARRPVIKKIARNSKNKIRNHPEKMFSKIPPATAASPVAFS